MFTLITKTLILLQIFLGEIFKVLVFLSLAIRALLKLEISGVAMQY